MWNVAVFLWTAMFDWAKITIGWAKNFGSFQQRKHVKFSKVFQVRLRVRVRLGLGVRENLLDSNKVFAESNVVKFYRSCSGDSCPRTVLGWTVIWLTPHSLSHFMSTKPDSSTAAINCENRWHVTHLELCSRLAVRDRELIDLLSNIIPSYTVPIVSIEYSQPE